MGWWRMKTVELGVGDWEQKGCGKEKNRKRNGEGEMEGKEGGRG